ncbi:hypothetical protein BX600DRAFT_430497 [Xylariales sp. PMI_506]|nr:hypothetical protein BX600DRAFT_430497 [Xylariales sp. PMI_506]
MSEPLVCMALPLSNLALSFPFLIMLDLQNLIEATEGVRHLVPIDNAKGPYSCAGRVRFKSKESLTCANAALGSGKYHVFYAHLAHRKILGWGESCLAFARTSDGYRQPRGASGLFGYHDRASEALGLRQEFSLGLQEMLVPNMREAVANPWATQISVDSRGKRHWACLLLFFGTVAKVAAQLARTHAAKP